MKRWPSFTGSALLLICCLNVEAQLMVPGELIDGRYPTFHEDSIRQLGIKSITLRTTDKPSSRPIYDRGRRAIYRFDKRGRMIAFSVVFPVRNGRVDTIYHTWKYEGKKLVMERERTGSYERKVIYKDSLRTVKVRHGNEAWQQAGREVVKEHSTSNSKTFTISAPGQEPYETQYTTLNDQGEPTSREIWNGPRLITREVWEYGDTLTSYALFLAGEMIPDKQISYVMKGNHYDHGRWCQRAKCRDWSLLYRDDGLPKAMLIFEPVNQDMEILEFQYVFRDQWR